MVTESNVTIIRGNEIRGELRGVVCRLSACC